MANYFPDEGEEWLGNHVLKTSGTRDTNLRIGIYSAPISPSVTTVYADITQVTGSGAAEKNLTDGTWTDNNDGSFTYTGGVTFTAAADFSDVYGYYITTGTTDNVLLVIGEDPAAPVDINNGDTYTVTPTIQFGTN